MPALAWTLLPAGALFAPPVADTRSPLSAVVVRYGDAGLKLDAALAAQVPIVGLDAGPVRLQAGLAAAAFMGFDPGASLTFGMETVDGYFAAPIDAAWGAWSARLQWAHVSAHLADGVLGRGDDRPERESYSREWVQLQAAGHWRWLRGYVGVQLVVHATGGAGTPFAAQAGAEAEPAGRLAPYAAVDVQVHEDQAWSPWAAAQLGAALHVGTRRLRLGVAGRLGPDDSGQLAEGTDRYVGVVFGFDGVVVPPPPSSNP